MNPVYTIAALTIREAVRRRLVAAFALISVVLVSLSGWGFYRLSHNNGFTSGETHAALPEAVILFMFMFSFVVALSASAVASPAISSEIESGVLQTIVARPVRRSEVLLAKFSSRCRSKIISTRPKAGGRLHRRPRPRHNVPGAV
jgi:ABC-type transport system involved in multi-copper enzyme maturation permease subunit